MITKKEKLSKPTHQALQLTTLIIISIYVTTLILMSPYQNFKKHIKHQVTLKHQTQIATRQIKTMHSTLQGLLRMQQKFSKILQPNTTQTTLEFTVNLIKRFNLKIISIKPLTLNTIHHSNKHVFKLQLIGSYTQLLQLINSLPKQNFLSWISELRLTRRRPTSPLLIQLQFEVYHA